MLHLNVAPLLLLQGRQQRSLHQCRFKCFFLTCCSKHNEPSPQNDRHQHSCRNLPAHKSTWPMLNHRASCEVFLLNNSSGLFHSASCNRQTGHLGFRVDMSGNNRFLFLVHRWPWQHPTSAFQSKNRRSGIGHQWFSWHNDIRHLLSPPLLSFHTKGCTLPHPCRCLSVLVSAFLHKLIQSQMGWPKPTKTRNGYSNLCRLNQSWCNVAELPLWWTGLLNR